MTGTSSQVDPGVIEKAQKIYDAWWETVLHVEAQKRYEKDLADAETKVKGLAAHATQVDFDLFKGQGPQFVLEFTTIVVIIFTVAMLGILGILGTEQIGTILAAIAGYVLGRAVTSSSKDNATQQTSTPPTTKDLAELLSVVRGTAPLANKPPTVGITLPVGTGQDFETKQPTVTVVGMAADDNAITSVNWTRTVNGAVKATGTASLGDGTTSRIWTIRDLTLDEGSDEISVIAHAASNNQSMPAKITVKYSKDGTATPPSTPAGTLIGKNGATQQTSTPPAPTVLAALPQAVQAAATLADKPPTVNISWPVATGQVHSTTQSSLTIEGDAADDNAVTAVNWTRTINGAVKAGGTASLGDGTTSRSWTIHDLKLAEGSNEISVIAQDASGNQSTPAQITVMYSKQHRH